MRVGTAAMLAVWMLLSGCDEPTSEEQQRPKTSQAEDDSEATSDVPPPDLDDSLDGDAQSLAGRGPIDAGQVTHDATVPAPDAGAPRGQAAAVDASSDAESSDEAGTARGGQMPDAAADAGATPALDAPPTVSNVIASVAFSRAPNGDPSPVLLFEGGYACWDRALAAQRPIDAAAHRLAHPQSWGQWRRVANGIEVKTNAGWNRLPYSYEYAPRAAGSQLAGSYERVFSPDPNGDPLVILVWRYRFRPDGTFDYCKTSQIAGQFPAFSLERMPRSGKYRVDGYALQLTDNAGMTTTESFFFDSSVNSGIWIGVNYVLPTAADTATCF